MARGRSGDLGQPRHHAPCPAVRRREVSPRAAPRDDPRHRAARVRRGRLLARELPPLDTDGRSPLDAARKLVPQIRSTADEIEARRELPRALFEAMADAGLFHMAVPRVIGGGELDLPTYVQVIEEIGKADASTGWCLNQGAIFGTYAARMPRAVARTILPGHRPPGLQHRLPARRLGRGPRADHRERQGPTRGRSARGALHVRAGRRGRAARHLAHPRHAGHGHAPLRCERRVRADRAHRAVTDRALARERAALPHPTDAAVRLG
ncbi:MAG: hypothetical protein DMD99_07010 [Candidatus Rokuibacteriota bacterium]|nr:MAG: hypothetical protein DMD99_07010 [Candidatus Rokubacteria bacterium]